MLTGEVSISLWRLDPSELGNESKCKKSEQSKKREPFLHWIVIIMDEYNHQIDATR